MPKPSDKILPPQFRKANIEARRRRLEIGISRLHLASYQLAQAVQAWDATERTDPHLQLAVAAKLRARIEVLITLQNPKLYPSARSPGLRTARAMLATDKRTLATLTTTTRRRKTS